MKYARVTRAAKLDVNEISDFIMEQAGIEQAVKVAIDIRRAVSTLAQTPGIGHFREDLLDRRYSSGQSILM